MEQFRVIGSLSALAQETRLEIYRLLVQAGPSGVAAGAIAEALGASPPTLSFHLGQLKQAGLITARRNGRSIVYAADFEAMNGLLGYLTENCCRGAPSACGVPACEPAPFVHQPSEASREAPARSRRR